MAKGTAARTSVVDFVSKFESVCQKCGNRIGVGVATRYDRETQFGTHLHCPVIPDVVVSLDGATLQARVQALDNQIQAMEAVATDTVLEQKGERPGVCRHCLGKGYVSWRDTMDSVGYDYLNATCSRGDDAVAANRKATYGAADPNPECVAESQARDAYAAAESQVFRAAQRASRHLVRERDRVKALLAPVRGAVVTSVFKRKPVTGVVTWMGTSNYTNEPTVGLRVDGAEKLVYVPAARCVVTATTRVYNPEDNGRKDGYEE